VEKFGANPSPDGAHEIDPTGEFSADYFEDFSNGLDTSAGRMNAIRGPREGISARRSA